VQHDWSEFFEEEHMIVGIPKEIKDHEYRVALTPVGAANLVGEGHQVLFQRGAGVGSGFGDEEYVKAGATLLEEPEDLFASAEMVVKVKEPLASEYTMLRPSLVLFTYLHLAGLPDLASILLEKQVTAVAYETVQSPDGNLPLLTPMSEVAGRLAVQVGAHYLERPQGGSGRLLAGVPGVPPAEAVILGAGVVGTNAASVALGMGAHVTIVTRSLERLRYLSQLLHGKLDTAVSTPEAIGLAVKGADLVIGAVLVPGGKAPRMVTREMVSTMRPGSVIVDVSVDQGGCIETTRPTGHSDPTYKVDEVLHYCVTNMPGAVPHTSTQALCNATLPYVMKIAKIGVAHAVKQDQSLARGLNTFDGKVTNEAVALALGLPWMSPEQALGI
jgi:alanine dehydrogenase